MVKKIAAGLGGVLLLLIVYAALKSPDYKVMREITINAPAQKIFPYLNNSKMAEKWGPWLETDPGAKMVYSGPDAGVGSRTSWDSKGQLGTGSATITESVPNERVLIRLEYTKPMEMIQDSVYAIRPIGNQSIVSWSVTGKNSFMGRFMCMFFDMDKMVGSMFEKGLKNLKGLMEKP